jgi:hypothetical protein
LNQALWEGCFGFSKSVAEYRKFNGIIHDILTYAKRTGLKSKMCDARGNWTQGKMTQALGAIYTPEQMTRQMTNPGNVRSRKASKGRSETKPQFFES